MIISYHSKARYKIFSLRRISEFNYHQEFFFFLSSENSIYVLCKISWFDQFWALNCWNWMLSQFHFFVINNPEGSFCCTKEFWNDLIFKANTVKNIREACCPTKPFMWQRSKLRAGPSISTFFHGLKKVTHSWELIITPFLLIEGCVHLEYISSGMLNWVLWEHITTSPYLYANSVFYVYRLFNHHFTIIDL